MNSFHDKVVELIWRVSEDIVLPKFRSLVARDIMEKSPGELVTVVDLEAEKVLEQGLADVLADARIIGEEAASVDSTILQRLDEGRVWLIDPIDGTGNFVAGCAPFGIMIALAEDGVVRASWIYDPLSRRLCHAVTGEGAFINNQKVHVRTIPRSRPIAALATQFMSVERRELFHRTADQKFDRVPIPRCAAEHYPRLCLGENDLGVFERTLPWDHAPGAHFLQQAGGIVTCWDGSPYLFSEGKYGILASNSHHTWLMARNLFVEAQEIIEIG